jgi:ribonuclease D
MVAIKEKIINTEIVFVNTAIGLRTMVEALQQKKVFSFDTEFDRFWREYGFKLFLLQIYDGDKCYIIDPIAIKDFSALWALFEDKTICKVAYACVEDIQLLKINGCNTVNIFDVQMAAKLCNHEANSFSDIIRMEYGIELDKSFQKSNWRKRPLLPAQMVYASNDVIWLLHLQEAFEKLARKRGVYEMLQEENEFCETVVVNEYTVKLSTKHFATLSTYHQTALLNLFNVRNEIAKLYNKPPANIVNDSVLEEIVINKNTFYAAGFEKGFCKELLEDEKSKSIFVKAINEIDETIENIVTKRERNEVRTPFSIREKYKINAATNCKLLHEVAVNKYGTIAGEFIIRGLKKQLEAKPYKDVELRNYQHNFINETCISLGITL